MESMLRIPKRASRVSVEGSQGRVENSDPRERASARITIDARTIVKSPPIAQTMSPGVMALSLSRVLNCRRLRVGNSHHAIAKPKNRMGKSTNAVPLTYQPMIGGMPNVLRSQGIMAATVSHSSGEKAANTIADGKTPIGAGVACLVVSMSNTTVYPEFAFL